MIYEEFKADFMKENKKLKIILFLSLIVFSVGTISNLISRKYFLYKGQAIFEERPLAEEICLTGFRSIASGTPNQNLLSKEMYDLVIKEPFPLNIQKVLQVQSLELGSCKIVLKADEKLMAYKISLDASNRNPFYYRLAQIDELGIPQEEE